MKGHGKKLFIWFIAGILLLLFLIIAVLIGKGKNDQKGYRLIYIPKTTDANNDFWTLLMEGVEMAAEEYQVEIQIVAPDTEEDYERQNELIEWAISCEPDAILLYGNHAVCRKSG